jgi:hypothetical protein
VKYTVRPATRLDAVRLIPRLRFEDAREIRSASGKEPIQVLPDCVSSGTTWALEADTLLALFGVNDLRYEDPIGVPWMVASSLLVEHQIFFLRNCRRWIDRLAEGYTGLINCVDARNELHIKWLKWCGFEFTHLHPQWGADKLPFWQFEKHYV